MLDLSLHSLSGTSNDTTVWTPSSLRPRYVGDFHTPDMANPKKAKLLLDISRRTVSNYRQKCEKLKRVNHKLMKKIATLEEAVEKMKNEHFLSENAADTLLVQVYC